MSKIIFVTGGIKSGKSQFALSLAQVYKEKTFIATAEVFDKEIKNKIKQHQKERDNTYTLIEEPIHIERILNKYHSSTQVIIVDCLIVWLNNLLYYHNKAFAINKIQQLKKTLLHIKTNVILVSNEINMSLIPIEKQNREFINLAGTLNQEMASISSKAYCIISGCPISLK